MPFFTKKLVGLIFALFLFSVFSSSSDSDFRKEYQTRRLAYLQRINDGVTLLFNKSHQDLEEYIPDKNFYYLTGCLEPEAVLLLIPGSVDWPETLFLVNRDLSQERWTGPRMSPGQESALLLGIQRVMSLDSFQTELTKLLLPASKIYTNLFRRSCKNPLVQCYFEPLSQLKRWLPLAKILDAAPEVAFLRMKKSSFELEKIIQAIKITMDGHRQAIREIRPGQFEYQVEAIIEHQFLSQGAIRPAFPSIVASGVNSTILHYSKNNRRMRSGELLVIDVGAEYDGYSADLTRTYPVNGRFTNRQKEIYNIVLEAQKASLKQVRPGVKYNKSSPIHQAAFEYINSHGWDQRGRRLGRYFIHGTSHHLGLDVHDPVSDSERPLEAGMVITIEPGIYIPEENLGVRIEDDVLVTDKGYQLLSETLPRSSTAIELMMAATKKKPLMTKRPRKEILDKAKPVGLKD